MSHRHSDCKCYGYPEKDTAACPWRQAENQVKELLLERKVLRETFAERARQNTKVAEQTPTNTRMDEIAWLEKLLEMHHTGHDWLDAYERSKQFVIERIAQLRHA